MTEISIRLFGNFSIFQGKKKITEIDSLRLKSLLAYMLLHIGVPQSRAYLAFLFWPNSSHSQAQTNLRNIIYRIRKNLPESDKLFQIDSHDITCCQCSFFEFDFLNFEESLSQSEKAKQVRDLPLWRKSLENAIKLYQGDLFLDCYDEWILPERSRFRQMYIMALEQLIELLSQQHEYHQAKNYAYRLLEIEPTHENTYRQLMMLAAFLNDRSSIVKSYQSCVSVLERELHVEPGIETRSLYKRLIISDDLNVSRNESVLKRIHTSLIGRNQEFLQIQTILSNVYRSESFFLLIRGERGMGKTRLIEEIQGYGDQQGITCKFSHCYFGIESIPYFPIKTWLLDSHKRESNKLWSNEVPNLIPEALLSHPGNFEMQNAFGNHRHQQFYDTLIYHVLESEKPHILIIDDLHWSDFYTLEWLMYLLHQKIDKRFLIIGTISPDETYVNQKIRIFIESLRRYSKLIEIDLKPLDFDQTVVLTRALSAEKFPHHFYKHFFEQTGGNPFFIESILRFCENQHKKGFVNQFDLHLPASPEIISMIKDRVAHLSEEARTLTSIGALIGFRFPYQILLEASEINESDLIQSLDELENWYIFEEDGSDYYRFHYPIYQEVICSMLSNARKKFYQRKIRNVLKF